jgi:hypothetical protein
MREATLGRRIMLVFTSTEYLDHTGLIGIQRPPFRER